jgi:hypothetical protein
MKMGKSKVYGLTIQKNHIAVCEAFYVNDVLDSTYIERDSVTGKVIVSGQYYLGEKQGAWIYHSFKSGTDSTVTY